MVALISMLVLPDFPSSSTSSHLTSLQHDFVIWRLQKDTALLGAAVEDVTTVPGDRDEKKITVWEAFRMLLADGKVWIFCGILTSTCEFLIHYQWHEMFRACNNGQQIQLPG